ncbi:aldo/keto reductase [Uniformispora flossi]|uniref:aldo/keto reductase n=1 Tax=Uniformispora flossi TaxID=3390723 RepID=UPI003C2DAC0C
MDYRNVGTSDLRVSAVGLGCNNFGMRIDEDQTRAVVDAALDAGVTLFDTADIYGGGASEEMLGKALGARRGQAVIATKFGGKMPYGQGTGRAHVVAAAEASLKRLGTDYIDLYYLHFPDASTPIDETLAALDDLVKAGKVRTVASSNLPAWEMVRAEYVARELGTARFAAAQVEWNLLTRGVEAEIVPASRAYGIGVIPYFPLASGLLSGKYRADQAFPDGSRLADMPYFASVATPENFAKVEKLRAYAEAHGRTLLELAVSWLAAQPGVPSVISGATKPEQVYANAAAADWAVDPADVLAAISEGGAA